MSPFTELQSVPAESSRPDALAAFRERGAQLSPIPSQQLPTQEQNAVRVADRAIAALIVIATAIDQDPGTGQVARLVRFVAGCITERTIRSTSRTCESSIRSLRTPVSSISITTGWEGERFTIICRAVNGRCIAGCATTGFTGSAFARMTCEAGLAHRDPGCCP